MAAFTQLLDRSLPAEVRLSAWCPTMDLLALATLDGQVAVHRLAWNPSSMQQLWNVTPEATVTALCWRPDGKALAVGHSDGVLTLLDVENGEVGSRQALHTASVLAISWVDGVAAHALEDRSARFFAPPPPSVPDDPSTTGDCYGDALRQEQHKPRWAQTGDALSVITSVDSAGRLLVSASGTSLLASFDVVELFRGGGGVDTATATTTAVAVLQSGDLCQLGVVVREAAGKTEELKLAVLDTSVLAERGAELQFLALQADKVTGLMEGALATLREAQEQWGVALGRVSDKWRTLSGLLQDHALASSPKRELINLLASGMPSAPLLHFLSSSLGEAGTKKLAKSVDSIINSVHKLLLNRLAPALEVVAFCLGELHGMAKCAPWMKPVCLQAEQLKAAEQECMLTMLRLKQVQQEVTARGAAFRSFFLWLLRTILLLNYEKLLQDTTWPVDTHGVLQFLDSMFEEDIIASELDGNMKAGVAGGGKRFEIPTHIAQLQSILYPEVEEGGGERCLGTLVTSLSLRCRDIFASIPAMLSASIAPLLCTKLATGKIREHNDTGIISCAKGSYADAGSDINIFLAASGISSHSTPTSSDCCVLNVSLRRSLPAPNDSVWAQLGLGDGPPTSARPQPNLAVIPFRMPAGTAVVGASFYKEGSLAMVSRGGEGECFMELLPYREQLPEAVAVDPANDGSTILQLSHDADATDLGALESRRLRQCPAISTDDHEPLSVCGPRGVGCLLPGQQRALIFEMEEDEGDDEMSDQSDG